MVDFAAQLRLDGQPQPTSSYEHSQTLYKAPQDEFYRPNTQTSNEDSGRSPSSNPYIQDGWVRTGPLQTGPQPCQVLHQPQTSYGAPWMDVQPGVRQFQPYLVQPHQIVSIEQDKSRVQPMPTSCSPSSPISPGSDSEHMLLDYMRGLHQMLLAQQTQLGIALQMQMQQQQQRQSPIIIQNTTQVAAESRMEARAAQSGSTLGIPKWIGRFWSSPANKVLIISTVLVTAYVVREHWRHEWKVEQWQRRVDSNVFLKGVQMLERSFGFTRSTY